MEFYNPFTQKPTFRKPSINKFNNQFSSTYNSNNNPFNKPSNNTYDTYNSSKVKDSIPLFIAVGPVTDPSSINSILSMLKDFGFSPKYNKIINGYSHVEYSPDPELPFFIFEGFAVVENGIWPKYDISFNGEPLYVEPCDIQNIEEQVYFVRNLKIHQKLLDFSYLKNNGFPLLKYYKNDEIETMKVIRFMLFLAAIKCYRYGYFDDNFNRNLSITHIRFVGNGLHSTNYFLTLKCLFKKLEFISFNDNPLELSECSQLKFSETGIQPYFGQDFDLSSFYKKQEIKNFVPEEKKSFKFKIHVPEIKENVVISNYLQIPCYEFANNFINANIDNIYLFYDIERCQISYTIDTCGKNTPLSFFSTISSTHDNQNIFGGQDAINSISNFYLDFPNREYYDYKCSQLTNNMIAFVLYGIFQHKSGYYFGINRVMTLISNESELKYSIINDNLFLHIQYE